MQSDDHASVFIMWWSLHVRTFGWRNDTTCCHFGARTVSAISERGASEKLRLKRQNCSKFVNQASLWIFVKHLQINYKNEMPQFHSPDIHIITFLWGTWGPSQYKDASLGIPTIKIKLSHDCVIVIMEIPIPGKAVFILRWGSAVDEYN